MRSPNNIDKTISRNLKRQRQNLDLSLQHVANKMGIAYQQLQKYENATNRIPASRLWRLSKIYNVPLIGFFEP